LKNVKSLNDKFESMVGTLAHFQRRGSSPLPPPSQHPRRGEDTAPYVGILPELLIIRREGAANNTFFLTLYR